MKNNPLRTSLAALVALALGACEGGVQPTEGGAVLEIRIEPQPARVEHESKLQLDARLMDGSGASVIGKRVFWASEDASIASVSETGEVTGLAPGTTRIAASAEGLSGVGTVTVVPKAVMRVTVTPEQVSLVAGESATLSAAALDRTGKPLDGRAVAWTSGDTKVATVDGSGRVTAVGEGSTAVRATVEGVTGEAALTVGRKAVETVEVAPATASLTVGERVQLAATARAADGSVVAGALTLWSSGNPDAVLVTETGVAVAVGPGTAVVSAQIDGRSGSASVTVAPRPVATIEISPASAQLVVQGTQQFTAILKAGDGAVLTGRAIEWTTGDPAVATVSATGLVSAAGVGQTTVRASSEGTFAEASLTVSATPVATVEVTPTSTQVLVGATEQLTAVAKDANGVELSGRQATWSSAASSIVTVTPTGEITGVAPGTATVTASIEGKTASATVTVLPIAVASVEVNPSSASIVIAGTRQFEATTRASNGAILTARVVTWSSSAPAIASVDAAGLVTAHLPGQTTITATSEGQSGSASVTVTPATTPVATVTVSPSPVQLLAGSTAQLSATLKAADGTTLTGRTVTWSSSAPAVAMVSPAGLVTAVSVGQATVTATSEGKSGSASVTVSLPPVATVTVAPGTAQLAVGGTAQLSATLKAADGTTLTGRTVTWSSSQGPVATVNTNGLVTAVAPGQATITATSEGITGSAAVTVMPSAPAPVATVTVAPSTAQLLVGATAQLSATLRAADGTTLTGRTVTWTSSAPAVATVSTAGLVTAVAGGQATISAVSEGKVGTASVTVSATPAPVATVTVAPTTAQLLVGATAQLSATLKAEDGGTLTGRPVTWTSSAPAVASVSSNGLVTAVAAGQATITATSEGKSGSAAVTVSTPPPLPVASVTVSPSTVNLRSGESRQLSVTLRAADGTVLTDRVVTWTSSAPVVAAVSSTGLVTGLLPGDAMITATSEGQSGSARATVRLGGGDGTVPPPPDTTGVAGAPEGYAPVSSTLPALHRLSAPAPVGRARAASREDEP